MTTRRKTARLKYDDSIYTFQAYQNVQTLKLYEFDCSICAFDCAINHSNPKLGPCSFGIESTDSEWNIALSSFFMFFLLILILIFDINIFL